MEQKIKEGIDKMKKTYDEKDKDKIQNDFVKDLINGLENFDFKNFKFKNGKYHYYGFKSNEYYIIHDQKFEFYHDGVKIKEGDFNYSYNYTFSDNKYYYYGIFIEAHGNIKIYDENNYEGEYFYNQKIGRGKIKDDKNEKFFCQIINSHYMLEDLIIIKKNDEERNNNLGIILVKDLNKEIIYEINVKIINEKTYANGEEYTEPEGIGLVKDNRNGEILIVNFDNNNILSKNLQDLSLFIDKQELEMNKKNKNNENSTQEQLINQNSKKVINDIINKTLENNNIENFANKINEKIVKEKIEKFGIQNQEYSGECWVYSLSEIIYMANARKYKRKLENFNEIYDGIVKDYGKTGKTNEEMEKIMRKILPSYGLSFEKVENEEILKDYIKRGIKCIATFNLNKKEWENFSDYFKTKEENKLLTKEILEKPNNNIENPDKITGHSVILTDIDDDNNYIFVNSWGKNWGNEGKFKSKKNCLKLTFYAVYYTIDSLTQEEKNSWENLKTDIKIYFNEFKSIRCTKCGKSAEIEKFHFIEPNKFKCPYLNCIFEIKENSEFLFEQFMLYDLDRKRNEIKKSIMAFD